MNGRGGYADDFHATTASGQFILLSDDRRSLFFDGGYGGRQVRLTHRQCQRIKRAAQRITDRASRAAASAQRSQTVSRAGDVLAPLR